MWDKVQFVGELQSDLIRHFGHEINITLHLQRIVCWESFSDIFPVYTWTYTFLACCSQAVDLPWDKIVGNATMQDMKVFSFEDKYIQMCFLSLNPLHPLQRKTYQNRSNTDTIYKRVT